MMMPAFSENSLNKHMWLKRAWLHPHLSSSAPCPCKCHAGCHSAQRRNGNASLAFLFSQWPPDKHRLNRSLPAGLLDPFTATCSFSLDKVSEFFQPQVNAGKAVFTAGTCQRQLYITN